jgi:hypothetical protein
MATAAQGLVGGLTAQLADAQARFEKAKSADVGTSLVERQIAILTADLDRAKAHAQSELDAMPTKPA